jgi:AraC-like DNA-binding protein
VTPVSTPWSTHDLDEATSVLTEVYAPHAMSVRGKDPFAFSFQAITSKQLTVGFNRFDTDVRIEVPAPSMFYTLCYAPDGAVRTSSGQRSMVASPTTATLLQPDDAWTFSDWRRGTSMLCIRIDRAALEEELQGLLGTPLSAPIDFGGLIDLRQGAGEDFARILHTLCTATGEPSALTELHPVVADHVGQLLRSALLVGCRHNYSEVLDSEQSLSGVSLPVRRVLEAVEADPMQVCTAAEAARIAHLSIRALEKAFGQHLGISPVRFARQARLMRARADLVDGDAAEHTVMSIAERWGFGHAGRFASLYEKRYGEPPSVTLKR